MPKDSEVRRVHKRVGLLAILVILPVSLFRGIEIEEASEIALQIIVLGDRAAAEEILRLLRAGERFEKLAAEHSLHPSASQGGYLGKMRPSALRPEIRDALKGLHPGQVTEVVETPSGYVILKLLSEAARVEIESTERNRKLAVAALGQVQIATDVSGLGWVENFFARLRKPPNWNQDLPTTCQSRLQAVDLGMHGIESYLSESKVQEPNQRDTAGIVSAHDALAQLWSYQGKMDKAIEHFQAAYEMAASTGAKDAQLQLEERLGIAQLHQAALENSATNAQVESCLFPIAPEARYQMGAASENAIRHFLHYLEQDPSNLEVKWLLNLAYMTLGKHPAGVPKEHLIPLEPFQSRENIGRFVDVAPLLGLNTFQMAGGAILDDFDNDGFLDIVTSSWDPCAPMHYFHNNGDGTFADRASQAGLSDQLGGLNLIQADYNNDGCLDILVLRGAWSLPVRKSLLRNNCDGTFADVTRESGLAVPPTSTQTAAWADFDIDGNIDLFVGNEFAPSQLFRNKGDGTFVDVAPLAGVDRNRFTKGVAAGDYDNDGYPDFYLSNLDGENLLYHNNRDGTFTDVAGALHVQAPLRSFPVWFFDYDNDGWLDLFVPSYYQSDVEVVASYLNLPVKGETLKLYRNTGQGTFQEVSADVGLDRVFMPMGANFGDVDNDGFLDFYLGTGAPSYGTIVPNVLFRNSHGKVFVDITASSGTGCLHKGHGVAFGDIDNDGDQDLLLEVGGAAPGDKHATRLFRNPGNQNNWINIRLVGVKTNRAALGARIKLTLETEDHRHREVHRVVGSGGSFGASPLQQHIGLGKATRIDTLEIWWPTSNTRQTFRNLPADQFIEIKEFEKSVTTLKRPSFLLGEVPTTRLAQGTIR